MTAVIEVRTYTTQPGKRGEIIELLERRLFAEMERLGIKVLGCYPSVDDDNVFVWLRGFPDAAAHGALTEAFYSGKLWTEELEQPVRAGIASISVQKVEDTTGLWDDWPHTGR